MFFKFLFVAVLLLAFAVFMAFLGYSFTQSSSVSSLSKEVSGSLIGRKLKIIFMLFGENAGTAWIHLLGYLSYLVAGSLVLGALYLLIFQPAHLIKF